MQVSASVSLLSFDKHTQCGRTVNIKNGYCGLLCESQLDAYDRMLKCRETGPCLEMH